jgi:hypothetical protein
MGTVAANVSRSQLALGRPTHAAINSALTAGFSSAFEVAGLIAIFGFMAALALVRHRQTSAIPSPRVEVEIAA